MRQASDETRRPPAASDRDDALCELLLAAAGGCSVSFAQLYESTHRRIFGIVLRIVRHRGEAEEVLQEIYLKVWSRSAQFDPRRGLVIYWLAGMAQRAAIDTLRRASSRPSELSEGWGDADPYGDFGSPYPGPDEQLEQQQTRRRVLAHLATLPPEQRESLVMAFFDGLTHAQMASKLACPLGTVKSRVRRALASLQPALLHARG